MPIMHLLFVLAVVYTLSSFVLFEELDTKDSQDASSFSLRALAYKAKASHRRLAKLIRRDLPRGVFLNKRVEASCSSDFGCILPRPQLFFGSTAFATPPEHRLAPASVPKFVTEAHLAAFDVSERSDRETAAVDDEPPPRGPPAASAREQMEQRRQERRERRERERRERDRERQERRDRERKAQEEAAQSTAEASSSDASKEATRPAAEPYKLSKRVQGELHDRDRIESLLGTKVDVVMNQLSLEMRGGISCGGKPVMEFKDMDAVLAAHPQLTEVVPEQDEIGSASFGKCAVVGNSGSLLGNNHGEEIDAHDTVIRFNGAPTARFEKDVGTKTTIRIQNVDNLGFRERNDKYLIFTARTKKDLQKYVNHRKRYRKRKQYTFNSEFWCHIWDWVSHRKLKPSTGLAGIVLALKTCDHPINLYGFSHNDTNFHYFNHLPDKVTTQDVYRFHPLLEEAEIYKELEAETLAKIIS